MYLLEWKIIKFKINRQYNVSKEQIIIIKFNLKIMLQKKDLRTLETVLTCIKAKISLDNVTR